MANKQVNIRDPDLAKVGVALERAAANARQLGFDTNTPVYVYRDGQIVNIVKEHRTTQSKKTTSAKKRHREKQPHLTRKPNQKRPGRTPD
jgi:hypothetical protein